MAANQDPKKAKEFLSLQESINKANAEQERILKESTNAIGGALEMLERQYQTQEKIKQAAKANLDYAEGFASASADANKYQAMVAANAKNIFKATGKVEDVQKAIVAAEAELVTMQKAGNQMLAENMKQRIDVLKRSKQTLKVQQQSAKGLGTINDMLGSNVDAVSEFMGKLPGGNHLVKMMGIDKLKDGIAESLSEAAMVNAEMGGGLKGATAGAKAFGKSLLTSLGPIALIAAGVAGLVMVFKQVSAQAHDLSHNTGLTYAQSKLLVKEANKQVASLGNQLSQQKDILAVQQESVKEFGIMGMMTTQQAGAVSDMGIAFGYGAQQAAKVNNAFMSMGVTADEAASAQQDLAAEAMKAGVNVGAVTADVAKNAKATSKYFGGNVKALKKAAIEAAKMGMSLETMAKVSDSLLDFENSISAQFELQAMTGKQMNFDLARQLALEGDIAGATKAVMDQVGSIHDFNKMDVLERKKLAQATGMDVDELQKSLVIKDKMGDLTSEELASMNALGLSASEMANMSSEDLQNKLASKQASEKTAAAFAAMKAQLVNALMPAAEAIMSIFSAMSPLFKIIGGAIQLAFAPITFAFKMMEKFKGVTMVIGGLLAAEYALRNKNNIAAGIQNTLGKKSVAYQKISQGFQIAKDVLTGKINMKEKIANAYAAVKNTLMNSELGTLIAIGAQKAWQGVMAAKDLVVQGSIFAIEQGKLAIQYAINAAKTVANVISMGAIGPLMASAGAAIAAAIPAIFTGFGMIPFGLGIPLAFAAVAGLIGLIASMSKGDDVVSSATGGGGYGSRVLFGPEGAISFNNKDTIVAGTDLFGQANDAMFAPKGALKMNDGAVGDMPDPPEAKIVGITGESVVKLSTGIAAMMGTVFGPSMVAALALSMPIIGATITAAIVAGAAATALIPKPVLILNPVLPVFETNPIMMMGSFLGGLFGGGDDAPDSGNAEIVAKLDEVKMAIANINIEMDGKKVGMMTRLADSFRR